MKNKQTKNCKTTENMATIDPRDMLEKKNVNGRPERIAEGKAPPANINLVIKTHPSDTFLLYIFYSYINCFL